MFRGPDVSYLNMFPSVLLDLSQNSLCWDLDANGDANGPGKGGGHVTKPEMPFAAARSANGGNELEELMCDLANSYPGESDTVALSPSGRSTTPVGDTILKLELALTPS